MPVHPRLHVLSHPLLQHKLTLLRRRDTPSSEFRRVMREIGLLLAYEVTRDLPLQSIPIDTPLEPMMAPQIAGKKLCFVPILRAGTGLLDGMLDLVPGARIGHMGISRDPASLAAIEYFLKLPEDLPDRLVVLLDPMLATGNSASAALSRLRMAGARELRFVCLLAAPEGVALLARDHPGVPVFTAAVDRTLDGHGYIRPGLGDAGDRLFGTK